MNGLSVEEKLTRAMVEAIPVPTYTRSHKPVPYGDAISLLLESIDNSLGFDLCSEDYGTNKSGSQMFARFVFETDHPETGLAVGLRQSYDKSIALGTVAGANVFVCSNGMFIGSALHCVRKNTVNVWADFRAMIQLQVSTALDGYKQVTGDANRWKREGITQREGYELIGVAMGESVLTPHQASVAFQDWDTPRHEVFADRTLHSLYQCFTEGLKKGQAARTPERHIAAHSFFQREGGASCLINAIPA